MSLVSQGNLIYLDRGQDDGLRAGDLLEVFRTGGGLPERKIGLVKLLSTEPHTAAGVLAKATARVQIGDRLRTKFSSAVNAMSLDGGESNSASANVQPVTPAGARTTLAPSTERSLLGKSRTERTRGTTTINLDDLADQLEYESGEVKVKPAGIPILQQLTDYLKTTVLHQQIRVEGHSDNMEIGPTLRGQFPTNWELSKARAAEIVRHLIEKGGMDSAKLSAVGYGASRPVASNATEEGRKKNRRIEVVIESSEDGPTAQPATTPAHVEETKPAQVSRNDMSLLPVEAAGVVSPPLAPRAGTSSDAPNDHNPSDSEIAEPATPTGSEPLPVPPGL
jgi:chemotaxis protein MotB